MAPLDAEDRRSLFFGRRAWVIGFCRSPRPGEAANAYLYLCRTQDYDLDAVSANTRSKIRRGLKRHEIRRIDENLVANEGYECFSDSRSRNRLTPPSRPAFHRFWSHLTPSPFRQIWGAFAQDELVAFFSIQCCKGWADNCLLAVRTSHLKDYAANAICFHVMHELLSGPNRVEGFSFGLSSLQPDSHINTLHRYKLSLGFEAVPVVRAFNLHPLLRPLVNQQTKRAVRIAGRLLPHNSVLRKAQGFIDFLLTGVLPLPDAAMLPPTGLPSGTEPVHDDHPLAVGLP